MIQADLRQRALLAILISLSLAGCGSSAVKDSAPSGSVGRLPDDPTPRSEPKGRYGNGPVYKVFGKNYTVMDDSAGYKERGVASWYGKKFHGRLTSSREPYDMYEMTAAHKTLPLPTYVKVHNLNNNKTIIVRVNDRGPFVDNRIIDLSYAAALRLDMIRDGTSFVEVTAINYDNAARAQPTMQSTPTRPSPPPQASAESSTESSRIFIQAGAFGSRDNANRRYATLKSGGLTGAIIHEDTSVEPPLYRVRIGPIKGVDDYDRIVQQLAKLGITDPILVPQ